MMRVFKSILKIIGITLGIFLVILVIILVKSLTKKYVPDGYENSVATGGDIESKYLQYGEYNVSYKEYSVIQSLKKFEIHYPSELEKSDMDKKYPLVVICNGSGLPASRYKNLFKHLASWGFVVIGTEEPYAWDGFAAEMSVRYLLDIDSKKTLGDNNEINPFYKKIDFERVGITGQSQGGIGVFNAISAQEHGYIYKAAVALSPTKMDLAKALYWDYDVSGITTPVMLLSSTEEVDYVDSKTLKEIYDGFSKSDYRVMATRNNATHNDMIYVSDGYVTAWFMWLLQGDSVAASAFSEDDAELLTNELYNNQIIQ